MNNLSAFLNPVQSTEPVEVVISRRFPGEDGRPVPFKIRPLTQEEKEQGHPAEEEAASLRQM
jgi:hypothetical protein